MWLKWSGRRWLLVGLFAIAVAASGACISGEWDDETSLILEKADQGDTAAIEYEGELLVAADDVPALFAAIDAADTEEEQRQLVLRYLKRQDWIGCLLDKFEEADEESKEIKCGGMVIVKKDDVSEFAAGVRSMAGDEERTDFVATHVAEWAATKQIDRAVERLKQIKNTQGIPLIGGIIDSTTRFSITWEGEVLIPEDEIPDLLEQFRSLDTDAAKRELVETYLRDRERF